MHVAGVTAPTIEEAVPLGHSRHVAELEAPTEVLKVPAGQGTHASATLYVPWVQLTLGAGLAVGVAVPLEDGVGGGESAPEGERVGVALIVGDVDAGDRDVAVGVGVSEGLAPMEKLAVGDTERVTVPLGDCDGVGDGDLQSGPLIGPLMPLFAENPVTLT